MPALFENTFNLLDDTFRNPWFLDRDMKNVEKKLYGDRAKNLMSTDIRETDDNYEMIIDLPGFKKEEIAVKLDNGYLVIAAEKGLEKDEVEDEKAKKEGRYIRRERYTGAVQRSFYVGGHLTKEDIKGKFEHGILTLDIPKKVPEKIENNKFITIE